MLSACSRWIAKIVVVAMTATVAPGAIKYRIDAGQTQNFPANGQIAVTVPANTTVTLHLWDDNSDNVHDIPTFNVTGTPAASGVLQVLIAEQNEPWPGQPNDFIASGARNWGGITFSNNNMRNAARLTASISGDVSGPVNVGKVFRLDAAGSILAAGDIRAFTPDGAGDPWKSVQTVRVGNQLAGDIIVDVPNTPPTNLGSIDSIVVSGSGGIRGDILAREGHIGSIYTQGDIGTSATIRSHIEAGRGLREVIATAEPVSYPPLNKNFYVDINSDVQHIYTGQYSFTDDGALHDIFTSGDYVGNITAGNLLGGTTANSTRSGILVGGTLDADIHVRHLVDRADIVAARIVKPVRIGRHLKGSIVAFDRTASAPAIPTIEIGIEPPVAGSGYESFRAGMVSSDPWPVTPTGNAASDGAAWISHSTPSDSGTIDSVIWAREVGRITIEAMHPYYTNNDFAEKANRPRIEVERVGVLTVNSAMQRGLVWSGIDDRWFGQATNDPSNDFAKIVGIPGVAAPTVSIGCVAPSADVWVQDFSTFSVNGDLNGEVHVPSLGATQLISIAGKLSDATSRSCICYTIPGSSTGCELPIENPDPNSNDSPNPRLRFAGVALPAEPYYPSKSAIRVKDAAGLHGQIIIDASNTTGTQRAATHWRGEVIVGDNTATPIVLSTSQAQPNQAPFYSRLPATLGGGAVGLVPFAIHAPSSNDLTGEVLNSEISPPYPCGEDYVFIDFYGPVELPGQSQPALLPPVSISHSVGGDFSRQYQYETTGTQGAATPTPGSYRWNGWSGHVPC